MQNKVYQSGLKFLFYDAIKKLYHGDVIFHHSLDNGIYASIVTEKEINIEEIKKYMQDLVEKDIPFIKKSVSKKDAYEFYLKKGYNEKALNVLNISNLSVSLFEFDGIHNYFYTHDMPNTSKEIDKFDLFLIKDKDVVLTYSDFTFRNNVYNSFHEYDDWLNRMKINYVSDLNQIVSNGDISNLIKKNDITVDNHLFDIAREIVSKKAKIILIAGPSSSGKTTTSKKLSMYLSSLGINALPLSLDDFFVERDETPLDENGNMDFECLESIDLKMFNKTIDDLLNGESVSIPTFDFIEGKKEFKNKIYKLEEHDCLVVEGLHALNPNLLTLSDKSMLYKIYVSPLTPLNVDRHNYISTTDNRLIRRIVRDFKTRGKTAEETLMVWPSVRRGEEKYIFPYTDEANAIHNTAYVYELGVLKVYVEPLLYSIKMDSPMFDEARRLLDNLKTFYTIPSELVDDENVLREFLGGSSFEE